MFFMGAVACFFVVGFLGFFVNQIQLLGIQTTSLNVSSLKIKKWYISSRLSLLCSCKTSLVVIRFYMQVQKGLHLKERPPAKKAVKNYLNFVLNGTYNVTYPKYQPKRRTGSSVPDNDECCDGEHGKKASEKAAEESKTTTEYANAMKLLNSIDNKLRSTEEGHGAHSSSSAVVDAAALTNTSNSDLFPSQQQTQSTTADPYEIDCKLWVLRDISTSAHVNNYFGISRQ